MSNNIAIVGATGLVGSTILEIIDKHEIPFDSLTLFSSARSAGKEIDFQGKTYTAEELTADKTAGGFDYVLMSAGGDTSKEFAPLFEENGAVVIDNSSAFRMDPEIDLVVPEVNQSNLDRKIIANPNCSTIQSVGPLNVLYEKFGLKRVAYTTYQSVSGSGFGGIEDLERGERGEEPKKYPYPIYNNVIPHIDDFLENGYTKEEEKMVNETRKILNVPDLPVTATCVRVPVTSAHAVAINVTLEQEPSVQEVKDAFENQTGIILQDNPDELLYPMPIHAGGNEAIYVGRIRKDESMENTYHLWTVSDNILKGAALNTVQILEQLMSN